MNFAKRILSFLLCALIVLSAYTFIPISNKAEAASTISKINALKKQFPDGKYWNHVGSSKNNPDGYTSTPCTHHGYNGSGCAIREGACDCNFFNNAIQCAGYAYKIAYELTGSLASESNGWTKLTSLKASNLYVGDIIRYLNNGHSITVVGVSGDTIAYTGANWGANCLIKWGTMDISQITGFSYVYHKNSNSTGNNNLSVVDQTSSEIWKAKSDNDSNLNIRSSASTSAGVIGAIPAGEKFEVLSKTYSTTTGYLWAKIRYGAQTGYCVLNYAEYVSGSTETLDIINLSDIYSGVSYKLNWNAIDGADSYKIYIYDSNGLSIKTYSSASTSRDILLSQPDEYYIKIVATNSKVNSWKVSSDKVVVSVFSSKLLKVSEIFLPDSITVTMGSKQVCDCQFNPSGATSDIKWTSSDSKIATVNSSGVVSGIKCGTAVISCQSKSNSKVSAKCSVTVNPPKVTQLKQTASGTSTTSAKVTWKKLDGVTAYRIYTVQSNGSFKKLADTKSASYTLSKLKTAAKQKLVVRAYVTIGSTNHYGAYSDAATVRTKPAKVTGLKLYNQTTSGYSIKWTKVSSASLYYIYRYDETNKAWKKIGSTSSTNFKLTGASNGKAYKYTVAAVIKNGSVYLAGSKANYVYGFRAPTAPKASATAKKTSITAKWSKSTGATGYEVLLLKKGDSKYTLVKTLKSSSTSFTISKLKANTTYYIRIKAVSSHGSQTKRTTSDYVKITTKKA